MRDNKLVWCDVDGVVADLHSEWCRLHNYRFNSDLRPDEITNWGFEGVPLQCSRDQMFDILRMESLYEGVRPVSGALDGIHALREAGLRVVFVTSSNEITAGQKMAWLRRHKFIDGSGWDYREVATVADKSLLRFAFASIDDYHENLKVMRSTIRILPDAPYNRVPGLESHGIFRVKGWDAIVKAILSSLRDAPSASYPSFGPDTWSGSESRQGYLLP